MEESALFRDLLEKKRIGAVDERHIDFPAGQQRLEIPDQVGLRVQRNGPLCQQDGEIDVARHVRTARNRRPELQQEPDAVCSAQDGKPSEIPIPSL